MRLLVSEDRIHELVLSVWRKLSGLLTPLKYVLIPLRYILIPLKYILVKYILIPLKIGLIPLKIIQGHLKWIWADVKSIIPSLPLQYSVGPAPVVGETAPPILYAPRGTPHILIFLRHLGCPFCELTVRNTIDLATQYPLFFVLISLGTEEENAAWLSSLGLSLRRNMCMVAGTSRVLHAAYGVGEIGLRDIFRRDVLERAMELRKQGIKNGFTIGTRYQTNGAIAINGHYRILYAHVARHAGDVSDIKAACEVLNQEFEQARSRYYH